MIQSTPSNNFSARVTDMPKVEIKICGLTNIDDAMAALDLGADYLGFVLYDKSPRSISAQDLATICRSLPPLARAVGVFVNAARSTVEQVADECGLYAVQIHGDEAAADFADMPLPTWRAVRLSDAGASPSPSEWKADRYVVDAAVEGMYGGTGIRADVKAAAVFAAEHPVMLAGGITPANARMAVDQVKPLGVDVSSGVEAEPGRKDPAKMRAFFQAVRGIE